MKKRLSILFLGFLIILSLFAFINYRKIISEVRVEDLGEFKEENLIPSSSQKQKVGNVALVELAGTPYEIGYQNGTLLKEEINQLLDDAFGRYLPHTSLKGRLAKAFILNLVKKIDKKIPLEYRQEMQGVADGAGRSYDDILLMNTFVDSFSGLHPLLLQSVLDITGLSKGCSTVVVHGGEKSDQLIVGQTVDYLIDFGAGQSVLYIIKKKDKKVIYLPSFPGVVFSINGINSDGLVLTQRDTPTGQGKVGTAMGVVVRGLLEDIGSLEDAREYLGGIDWSISRSVLIADSENNISSFFEVLRGRGFKEVKIEKGYAGAANHYKAKELQEIQEGMLDKCRKLKFICRYDDYLDAYNGSREREKFLEDFVEQERWITPQKVIGAISNYIPDDSIKIGGKTVANEFTLQAMVFVPEEKVIYMANGITPPVTQGGFVKIELK